MADSSTVVHIGENSPEHVAYNLMKLVAQVEKKSFSVNARDVGETMADRAYILNTYAECRAVVRAEKPTKPAYAATVPIMGR